MVPISRFGYFILSWISFCHLYKERDCVESSDDYSVVDVSGQDVQRPCAALHDLLHANALLKTRYSAAISARLWCNELRVWSGRCRATHHKLLLRAAHAGASLRVLVRSDQQLDQSGDGALLPQGGVVSGAQGQVSDQTHCGLQGAEAFEFRSISVQGVKAGNVRQERSCSLRHKKLGC